MDLNLLGIRHVALNVRDVQRSMEFYRDLFGMELEWMPDEKNAYLTCAGQDNLALHEAPLPAESSPHQSLDHIGFVVRRPEDVDAWAKRVRERGIAFHQEPKTHRDGARSFYFRDPDGNLIQLIYHAPISDRPAD